MRVIVSVMLPSVKSDLGECVEATASNMDNYTGELPKAFTAILLARPHSAKLLLFDTLRF